MTHGDDDGLRVPPAIAPHQIVILPMLRDNDSDAELLEYCQSIRDELSAQNALREPIRVLLDQKPGKAAAKRWNWVRKGAPIIVEVGQRDLANGKVAVLRRDDLWNTDNGKPNFDFAEHDGFLGKASAMLEEIQTKLFAQAAERRDANITRGISSLDELRAFYTSKDKYPGWAEVQWSCPTGDELEQVVKTLKELKLTVRNVPQGAEPADGTCIFTGKPAKERIFVARSY